MMYDLRNNSNLKWRVLTGATTLPLGGTLGLALSLFSNAGGDERAYMGYGMAVMASFVIFILCAYYCASRITSSGASTRMPQDEQEVRVDELLRNTEEESGYTP